MMAETVRPEPTPKRPMQELLQEVIEARTAGEVSEARLTAAQLGYEAGPLVRLERLIDTAASSSYVLDPSAGSISAPGSTPLVGNLPFSPERSTTRPPISPPRSVCCRRTAPEYHRGYDPARS